MAESSNDEERRKETSRTNEYFVPANYQPGLMVPPHYFTQPLYYPYINPYSHLTESNRNVSIHGYGSDGRPKFRRSRTIFSPEQLDILEEHFEKYKYPDVKRRRTIAEDVGLPEERVQVWFQNRRAKDKRQTDQQVKLQKLVDEAIGTNTGNEHQHLQKIQRNSDQTDGSISSQNPQECQQSPFDRPHPRDKEAENDDSRTFHRKNSKSPTLDNPEMANQRESLPNCNVDSRAEIMLPEASGDVLLQKRVENGSTSQNMWTQPDNSTFGTPEAQVVIQNIDQDLLFKVANILSASNDATSLISEWSQTPNKTQTNNLEEQLRHFAEHHQQVLIANQNAENTNTPCNNRTQENG